MTSALDERDRIRAAMDRILSGAPQRSNGALTIVALAQEADVPRNALTQRHLDLKNEFYQRVTEREATPDVEIRLRDTITKLKKTIANKNEELEQLRADVPALVRVVSSPWKTKNSATCSTTPPPTSSPSPTGNHPAPATDSLNAILGPSGLTGDGCGRVAWERLTGAAGGTDCGAHCGRACSHGR
jgi:uncharacterized coiled-coil protein SlyX